QAGRSQRGQARDVALELLRRLDVALVRAGEQAQDPHRAQGRIGGEGGIDALQRTVDLQRDVVGVAAGLRLDVEERVDARGVREVDGAAADGVRVALEVHASAVDLRAAQHHGGRVAALQREVGARLQGGQVVVDLQRARRLDLDVVAHAAPD